MLISNISRSNKQFTKPRFPNWIQEQIQLIWVYNRLSKNLLRVVCEYFQLRLLLFHLKNNQLRCFDLTLQKWQPLFLLSADLSNEYSFCYTLTMCDVGTFVICGGLKKNSAAHIIENGRVTALPNMTHGRYSHGAVHISLCNKVYVFGGADNGAINHCESLVLHTQSWHERAPMHKRRADINPLLYCDSVYIVGGDIECTIESYSWKNDFFTLFPSLKIRRVTHFLSIITDDSILCLSESCNYRVNLQTGRISERFKHERIPIGNTVSMMKLYDIVLFADELRCVSYSLEDGMVVEIIEDA